MIIILLAFVGVRAQVSCPPNNNGSLCTGPEDTFVSTFPVSTPNLTSLNAHKWKSFSDYSCNLMPLFDNVVQGFSNITLLSCPSPEYNCHGYVWHMQYGGQNAVIQNDQISKYWNDGSFYEVNFVPQNAKGVVVYADNKHSAVTVPGSNPMKFRSKWGQGYLVEHLPNSVPSSYGSPQRYYLRCGTCDAAPNMFQISYNLGNVNTVNFVSAGGYNLNTNLQPCQLNADVNWSANGNSWGSSGNRKTSAWFNLSSGQSLTFTIGAPSGCGTSNRNVTFVAQSGYRMANTANVKDRLEIEFDNTEYIEILPQQILIFDEKTGKEELKVSVKDLFDNKQILNNKVSIDVKKLGRGMKIVNFLYLKLDSKEAQEKLRGGTASAEIERKTDRIVLID